MGTASSKGALAAVRKNWREMSWDRRILLMLMAGMIVGFGIAVGVAVTRPGMAYGDALLYARTEEDTRFYEGALDGARAVFSAAPDGTVTYWWGTYEYGPYQVTEDASAAPETWMTGLEIRQGEQVLFRGGFDENGYLPLYWENGEPLWDIGIHIQTNTGGVMGEDGQRELHQPGLTILARVAMEPELVHRGSVGIYLLVTLLALFNAVQICCPNLMFRLSLLGYVRNLDEAEPSDFYLLMERIQWVVLTAVCLALYWLCLNTIW